MQRTREGGRARREAQRSGDHDQPRTEQTRWIERGGQSATPAPTSNPAALGTPVTSSTTAAGKAAAVVLEVTPRGFEPLFYP